MGDSGGRKGEAADKLRSNAEAHLRESPTGLKPPQSKEDTQKIFHELEVCSIELEMQNSELVRSQADLEDAFSKLSDLYEFAPICYLTLDSTGRISAVNLSGAGILGEERSQILGRRFGLFLAQESRPAFADFLNNVFTSQIKKTCEVELKIEAKTPFFVQVDAIVATNGKECRLALVDITERKLLESRLFHAQKLESLGVLAGGIAHDFNNILMAIFGNVDLAMFHIDKDSPAIENLQRIRQAAERSADLTKQMLAYSGRGKFVIEKLDLNKLIENMLQMLNVSISKKAAVKLNLQYPLPLVEADATQMHQIVRNLVINASEAILKEGGLITLTTGHMDCDSSYLDNNWHGQGLTEGRYVCLEIADTGCGMDKETTAKLYDPFFTTKFTGRGLGLAAVQGIVKGHKGAIKVSSEPGRGSIFKVMLPASDLSADITDSDFYNGNWMGSGPVLLVDDEEAVRDVGAKMLRMLGFTAVTAQDGIEAIGIFEKNQNFRFVILDLTMPGMNGYQCFNELPRLNPSVKVIMSSGYNEQEVTKDLACQGLSGFVQKPYSLSVLSDIIKAVSECKAQ